MAQTSRPLPAPPAPGAPPPRARPLGEPSEGRAAAGRERGARATGPGPGRLTAPPGRGARDGADAAPSDPRPSAEGLAACWGRLAGEDPSRGWGGLADWGPRATTQPNYPESGRLCPSPVTVGVCAFGLTPQFHGQFSTAARGTDLGTPWPWAAVTTGCVWNCCWDYTMEHRCQRETLWWLFPGGMRGFWPHHSQPSFAMCQGVCCCLWGCNCGCYLLLCVYILGDSTMCQCLCGCDSGAVVCGGSLCLAVW